MKKIILSAVFFTFFSVPMVNAQKVRIGFSGGTTLAQIRTKVDNKNDNSSFHPGFSAGILVQLLLGGQLSLQTGLGFLQKGGKESESFGGITTKYTAVLNYLELPVNFVYRSKGEKGHFIAGAGPSFAYCLSGKAKASSENQSSSEDFKIGYGTDDELKPFEFGVNMLAGYESSMGILVTFNYNIGLSNSYNDGNAAWKNNYFGLKLGYFIRGKK